MANTFNLFYRASEGGGLTGWMTVQRRQHQIQDKMKKKKRQQEERTVKSLNEAGWRITVGDGNKWRERTELWKKKS